MRNNCEICGALGVAIGQKYGTFSQRHYEVQHCETCRFSWIANPWTDFAAIYSEDYYRGRGADPLVDYMFELDHPLQTIRHYEWKGILRAVQSLTTVDSTTSWLDFGCGNGGLVRFVRQHQPCAIVGYDEGWATSRAAQLGIPLLQQIDLDAMAGSFDIITAIEVVEHLINPLETFRTIRRLLKPGGLFFLTTGNAQPFRGRLTTWGYLMPEVHVSFYEPETLTRAMAQTGFRTTPGRFLAGSEDIIRFKVLKTLGIRKRHLLESLIPWPIAARAINARLGVTAHPIARAG
jgi:2-polyprenyl-3-methyl-5-hydroxy-6-metoxy-1,4-benzoquinol methylase